MVKKCQCGMAKFGGVLLIIGGLNWGLVGLGMLMKADWNIVHILFGSMPMLEGIVYLLVGIAAVMAIFGCKCAKCKACMAGGAMDKGAAPMGGAKM
jgi:hypothetical protein